MDGTVSTAITYTPDVLKANGCFNLESLEADADTEEYEIENLFLKHSINIIVGHSNLGKTPLAMQLGVAQVTGVPFLGNKVVSAGQVLYADAEGGKNGTKRTLRAIKGHLDIESSIPDFAIWNPYWSASPQAKSIGVQLFEKVRSLEPRLVIVDSLRMFYPAVIEKQSDAMAMIRRMRALSSKVGCYWLLIHHIRKSDRSKDRATLEDQHMYFEEAAGSHSLINSTDTRLGLEACSSPGQGDLTLAGFVRLEGWLGPYTLTRAYNGEDGSPVGYDLVTGIDHLNQRYRKIYTDLLDAFRFRDLKEHALAGSSATTFLRNCMALGLLSKSESGEYQKIEQKR